MLRLRDSKEFTLEHMISQGQPRKSKIPVPDQHQNNAEKIPPKAHSSLFFPHNISDQDTILLTLIFISHRL